MKRNTIGKLILLGATSVAAIHIINRIQYSRSTMKNILSSADNLFYEWRFGKIRYTKKGSGSPILLIHDLTVGSSSYEFSKITNQLSKKHEVYCLDLLGYGLSDKPEITFTNYLYVQLISDFVKNIIGKKTDMVAVGHSFPVAVLCCHNDSELFRNVVGINPQSLFQLNQIPSKQTKILKYLIETPIIGTFVFNIVTDKSTFKTIFRNKLYSDKRKIDVKDVEAYVEASHISDYRSKYAQASLLGRYMNANIIHALKEVNNSIFIIAGEDKKDNKNIVENYTYFNNAIETVFISETKQLPHMEKPSEVLKYIDMYLQ